VVAAERSHKRTRVTVGGGNPAMAEGKRSGGRGRLKSADGSGKRAPARGVRTTKLPRSTRTTSLEAEARARAIVNTALDGIISFDEDGIIDSFNPAAEPMFACAAEEALGRNIGSFLPLFYVHRDAEHDEHVDPLGRSGGETLCIGSETVGCRNDDSRFPAEVTVSEMRLGERRMFTAFVRDITQRKRAQEALKSFAERLARSNRELQDFASVAAHDLQEPLRKIQAFGDRLRSRCEADLSEDGKRYLDRIEDAAARMRRLINDLLAFSRVASRGQPFAAVSLNEVAHEVVADLETQIEAVKGRVVLADLPEIDADRTQIGQLLQNLIGNGLKFHAETAPVVKVSARLLSGRSSRGSRDRGGRSWCEISVKDNGIGFDEKYLDRIFTLFQRLHGRHEYEGTGVGLAICRRIAERHGGTISARSKPGQGAEFIVTLPTGHPRTESAE
jgi:two-component system, LuxR family, sensor kinase FixL